jgi:hypothetical protein
MDLLSKFLADLGTVHWWLSVVIVGIAVNLASAYMKPPVDGLLGKISARRREKYKLAFEEFQDEVCRLEENADLRVMAGFREMRLRFNFAIQFALSAALGALGVYSLGRVLGGARAEYLYVAVPAIVLGTWYLIRAVKIQKAALHITLVLRVVEDRIAEQIAK